jgi:hypothetical protein
MGSFGARDAIFPLTLRLEFIEPSTTIVHEPPLIGPITKQRCGPYFKVIAPTEFVNPAVVVLLHSKIAQRHANLGFCLVMPTHAGSVR